MTFEEIIKNLKNKVYSPVYFLMGDESYFIDLISDYISENVLSETEKAFNYSVFYGRDTDVPNIINTAKRYPMMSPYQVVILREAQDLKNIEDLIYYVSSPLSSTILVINYKYKTLDKRKKLNKVIEDKGVLFESKKLYENKVPEWITKYLKNKNFDIQPPAAILLTDFLGNDLSKIANELDKLMLIMPAGQNMISSAIIEHNIGISKEFNNLELQKALVQRNTLKAFRIAEYFGDNQKNNPFVLTLTSLYYFYNKLFLYHFIENKSAANIASVLKINPYFVQDYQNAAKVFPPAKVVQIISLLREYDLKSKGVRNLSATPKDLLKEMVYKILN